MPTYIPGISASGTLAPGLTPAVVRAVLELLSSAEIAAAYLPLAGGTMAGDLDMDHYGIINVQSIDSDEITLNSVPVATTVYVDDEVSANGVSLQAFASNASNLTSGTVSDARLSANVPLKNAANTFTAAQSFGSAGQTSINTSGQLAVGGTQTTFGPAGSGRSFINTSAGLALGSGLPIAWSTNVDAGAAGSDASIRRNSTGPTLETRAAGGARICNADGSALAALACGSIDVTPVNASWLFSSTEALIKRGNTGIGTASGGFGSTSLFFSVNSQNSMCLVPGSGMGWLLLNNSYMIGFAPAPASFHATTTLSEASTGVMQIGTSGASGKNALGSLNLTNLTASGDVLLSGSARTITIGNSLPYNYIANYNSSGSVDVSANSLVTVRTGNVERARFDSSGLTASGNILPATHNASDLGSSGVRFKTGYFATGVTAAGQSNFATISTATLTASGAITFAPITKSALLATSATATAGVWRITDSTPAQRLAYPDGTNWRYMSDDSIVT